MADHGDRAAGTAGLLADAQRLRTAGRASVHVKTDPVPAHGFDGIVRCEVLELVPARRLRISWAGGGLDTTVTWDLVPEGRGTRLLLSHEGFDEDDPGQQATMRILGGGWAGHLARRLEQTLASEP